MSTPYAEMPVPDGESLAYPEPPDQVVDEAALLAQQREAAEDFHLAGENGEPDG